jgi:hypothetical protein
MAVMVMLTSFTSGCIITAYNSPPNTMFFTETTLSPQTLQPFFSPETWILTDQASVHKLQKYPLAIPDTKTYQDLEIWRCSGARQIGRKEWVDLSTRKKREAKKKMEASRTPNFVTRRPKKKAATCSKEIFGKKGPNSPYF